MKLNLTTVQPRGTRLLIRPLAKSEMLEKVGSLYLTETTQENQRFRQWEVVAVGDEVRDPALLPGAQIVVDAYGGSPFDIEGEPYAFIEEERVSCVLVDE